MLCRVKLILMKGGDVLAGGPGGSVEAATANVADRAARQLAHQLAHQGTSMSGTVHRDGPAPSKRSTPLCRLTHTILTFLPAGRQPAGVCFSCDRDQLHWHRQGKCHSSSRFGKSNVQPDQAMIGAFDQIRCWRCDRPEDTGIMNSQVTRRQHIVRSKIAN